MSGVTRIIPIQVEGRPTVKPKPMGMGNSTRSKTVRDSDELGNGGPHVTRIKVNSQESGNNTPCASPVPPKLEPMQIIADVVSEVEKYEKEINEFVGDSGDKQYRFFDEMLTRLMIKLDNVETDGQPDIRAARKEAVNKVHQCVGMLEKRSNMNGGDVNKGESKDEQNDSDFGEENFHSANDTNYSADQLPNNVSMESPPPPTLGTETAV